MTDKKEKQRELRIVDIDGNVLQSVYVDDPSCGFRGANLEGLNATYGQLQGLDFSGAQLYWAIFRDADVSFGLFVDADMRGSILERTICRNTNFRGAKLGRDNVGGRTKLVGCQLATANLTNCDLEGAVYDDQTTFPPGFSPQERGLVHVDDLARVQREK